MTKSGTSGALRTHAGGTMRTSGDIDTVGSADGAAGATLRVVQVHSADVGGGAETTARLHHQELLRRGYRSRFLVARSRSGGPGIEPIPFVRGPRGLLRSARWLERNTGIQYPYSPSFRRLLHRLPDEADIVHLHSLHGAEGYADLGCIARLSRRTPVVLTVHDMWLVTGHCGLPLECARWRTGCGRCPDLQRYPSISRDATRINWWRKRLAFRTANVHLITPSRWVAEQLQHSPILGHLPHSVVHGPLNTSCFTPGDRAAARAELELPQDRRIVLLIAQHLSNVYKGLPEGVRALNLIDDPRLFIVAIGHDAEALLQQCRAPGRAVAYHADQSGLARYYRAADVFLMPSRCETFGMVAAESMACGTPVVAFQAGGLADAVGVGGGGLLVPPGDIAALAAAMRRILDDRQLQHELGELGAQRAAREFSIENHTRRCLDVYDQLRAAHPASRATTTPR